MWLDVVFGVALGLGLGLFDQLVDPSIKLQVDRCLMLLSFWCLMDHLHVTPFVVVSSFCVDLGLRLGVHRLWRHRVFPTRTYAHDGELPEQSGKLRRAVLSRIVSSPSACLFFSSC